MMRIVVRIATKTNFISITLALQKFTYWCFWSSSPNSNKHAVFNCILNCLFCLYYWLTSEHFGENRLSRRLMVAKLRCIKLCAIYSGPSCIRNKSNLISAILCKKINLENMLCVYFLSNFVQLYFHVTMLLVSWRWFCRCSWSLCPSITFSSSLAVTAPADGSVVPPSVLSIHRRSVLLAPPVFFASFALKSID